MNIDDQCQRGEFWQVPMNGRFCAVSLFPLREYGEPMDFRKVNPLLAVDRFGKCWNFSTCLTLAVLWRKPEGE